MILEVNVKILDLVNTTESKEFAKDFASTEKLFSINARGSERMYTDINGNKMNIKNGEMELVELVGAIPIKIKATIVSSESEITDTDNVLILANDVVLHGTHPLGYTLGQVAVIRDLNKRTAWHEIFHQLGLMDEYNKNLDGTVTARYADNLMDLNGMKLTDQQGATLLAYAIQNIGTSKTPKGVQATFGGTKADINTMKLKHIP
jgi:hypothetical protein